MGIGMVIGNHVQGLFWSLVVLAIGLWLINSNRWWMATPGVVLFAGGAGLVSSILLYDGGRRWAYAITALALGYAGFVIIQARNKEQVSFPRPNGRPEGGYLIPIVAGLAILIAVVYVLTSDLFGNLFGQWDQFERSMDRAVDFVNPMLREFNRWLAK